MWRRRGVGMSYSVAYPTAVERVKNKSYAVKEQMKTSGHKGVKLPRINLAFAPDVYEYIQIMSRVRGDNLTAFVNLALRQHMKEHGDLYEKAKEFRDALDSL